VSVASAEITRRAHPPRRWSVSSRLFSEPVLFGTLGFVVVLVVWEAVVDVGLAKALLISSPTRVASAAIADFTSGVIWPHIRVSLLEWTSGFALGLVTSIPVGLVLGYFRRAEFLFDPILAAAYATPLVALVPMIVLVFGVGTESKIFVVWLETFITVAITTLAGGHAADKRYLDIARSFGASRWLTFRSVNLPSSVPYIITGVRLGAGRALVGVVIAEFIASNVGIGFYISFNGTLLNTSRVMLGVVLIGLFGLVIGQVIRRIEQRFESWRPSIHS
jgi:ABC-type nitrate/sulfonate/bicarbonate transport system permease component